MDAEIASEIEGFETAWTAHEQKLLQATLKVVPLSDTKFLSVCHHTCPLPPSRLRVERFPVLAPAQGPEAIPASCTLFMAWHPSLSSVLFPRPRPLPPLPTISTPCHALLPPWNPCALLLQSKLGEDWIEQDGVEGGPATYLNLRTGGAYGSHNPVPVLGTHSSLRVSLTFSLLTSRSACCPQALCTRSTR